jgi:hypothetical protein
LKEVVFPQNLPAAVVEKNYIPGDGDHLKRESEKFGMAYHRDLSALLHCLVSEHVNRTYLLQDDKKFVKRCR